MLNNERHRVLDSKFVGPFGSLWERLEKDDTYLQKGRLLWHKIRGIFTKSSTLTARLGTDGNYGPHWESPEVPVDMYNLTVRDKSRTHTGRLQIVQRDGLERESTYSYPDQPVTIRLIEGYDLVERILFTIEPNGLVRDWMGEKAPEVGVNGLDMVKKLLDHIEQNLPQPPTPTSQA